MWPTNLTSTWVILGLFLLLEIGSLRSHSIAQIANGTPQESSGVEESSYEPKYMEVEQMSNEAQNEHRSQGQATLSSLHGRLRTNTSKPSGHGKSRKPNKHRHHRSFSQPPGLGLAFLSGGPNSQGNAVQPSEFQSATESPFVGRRPQRLRSHPIQFNRTKSTAGRGAVGSTPPGQRPLLAEGQSPQFKLQQHQGKINNLNPQPSPVYIRPSEFQSATERTFVGRRPQLLRSNPIQFNRFKSTAGRGSIGSTPPGRRPLSAKGQSPQFKLQQPQGKINNPNPQPSPVYIQPRFQSATGSQFVSRRPKILRSDPIQFNRFKSTAGRGSIGSTPTGRRPLSAKGQSPQFKLQQHKGKINNFNSQPSPVYIRPREFQSATESPFVGRRPQLLRSNPIQFNRTKSTAGRGSIGSTAPGRRPLSAKGQSPQFKLQQPQGEINNPNPQPSPVYFRKNVQSNRLSGPKLNPVKAREPGGLILNLPLLSPKNGLLGLGKLFKNKKPPHRPGGKGKSSLEDLERIYGNRVSLPPDRDFSPIGHPPTRKPARTTRAPIVCTGGGFDDYGNAVEACAGVG